MVSCSGFGLPMHAQLLRLFVTHSTLRLLVTRESDLGDNCYKETPQQ